MAQLHRVYEDFVPTTEWVRDAGYDTLLVYLPGFTKEQLKVQVTSAQNLRILGERPIGDNKFSRFRKELRIPLNYDSNQMNAKFEGGILKIKHPKRTTPATKLQENANSSAENQEFQKPPNEVKDKKNRQEQAAQQIPQKNKKLQENANSSSENQEFQKPPNEIKNQKNGQEQAAQGVPQKNKMENEKKTNVNNNNDNITAVTDAKDVSGKFQKNEKINDGLVGGGKIVSNKLEKAEEITGSGESKLVYYKQVFDGLVTEMKKKTRKSTDMVVAAGLLVLLIGFYVKSSIKYGESEK